MCFYVHVKIKKEDLKKQFKSLNPDIKDFKYPVEDMTSGFDKPELPILIHQTNFVIEPFNWGLIPNWAEHTHNFAINTLNAREETLLNKSSFKDYIDIQRGILPINGFYEWQHIGKQKIKHLISHSNQIILNIGVVFHRFINQNHQEIKTFAIITQKANPLMEKIHNTKKRMPFIIPKGEEEIWISSDLNYTEAKQSIHSLKDDELNAKIMIEHINNTQINLF
ncbi:MAG: SOS response-associated peptidase family protein [Bacteroidota bacterium]|nr:SOS response-associated peptidase family protein [Bacteroidota bacterium]